jgi:hypothetical protein
MKDPDPIYGKCKECGSRTINYTCVNCLKAQRDAALAQVEKLKKALHVIIGIGEISEGNPTEGYNDTMRVHDCMLIAREAVNDPAKSATGEYRMHGYGILVCLCPIERLKPGDRVTRIRPGEPWDGELLEIVTSEWSEEARRSNANICCYMVRAVKDGLLSYAMPDELVAHKVN